MSFHNVSLPDDLQYGSTFGGGFNTIIQETASGHEYRIARQAQHRHRYRLVQSLRDSTEAHTLKHFALGRRGALHSWRLRDVFDFSSAFNGRGTPTDLDQIIGVGDGTETRYQLVKKYDEAGVEPYARPIELPVAGSVVVSVNGSSIGNAFTLTEPGGVVTLASPPTAGHLVQAGFLFDVPVRFANDGDSWLNMVAEAFDVWTPQATECVEVLNEVEQPELWNPGGAKSRTVSSSFTLSYAEGLLQVVTAQANISMFLPHPLFAIGGPRHFVLVNHSSSTGTIQIRDDAGSAIGAARASGSTTRIGLVNDGAGSFTWNLY